MKNIYTWAAKLAKRTLTVGDLKTSKGIEFRLFGYNVYSYPLAITYEYHIADGKKDGKHYFRVLFDF